MPSGSVTCTFLGWPSAMPLRGFPDPELGIFSSKLRPLGFSASLLVGAAAIVGVEGHLVARRRECTLSDEFFDEASEPSGTFQGSTSIGNWSALAQETGMRR